MYNIKSLQKIFQGATKLAAKGIFEAFATVWQGYGAWMSNIFSCILQFSWSQKNCVLDPVQENVRGATNAIQMQKNAEENRKIADEINFLKNLKSIKSSVEKERKEGGK